MQANEAQFVVSSLWIRPLRGSLGSQNSLNSYQSSASEVVKAKVRELRIVNIVMARIFIFINYRNELVTLLNNL